MTTPQRNGTGLGARADGGGAWRDCGQMRMAPHHHPAAGPCAVPAQRLLLRQRAGALSLWRPAVSDGRRFALDRFQQAV